MFLWTDLTWIKSTVVPQVVGIAGGIATGELMASWVGILPFSAFITQDLGPISQIPGLGQYPFVAVISLIAWLLLTNVTKTLNENTSATGRLSKKADHQTAVLLLLYERDRTDKMPEVRDLLARLKEAEDG